MTDEAERLIQRARESFERRDYVAALADLRDAVEDHPQYADIRQLMGLCLSFLGQPEEALAEFDHAVTLNDQYIEAHLNRAIVLNELGRYHDAREAFARAAAAERRRGGRFSASESASIANAHANVAELYLAAADPERAAAELRKALDLRPDFQDLRNRLGEALMQQGELDEAKGAFEQTLAENDHFLRARLNLGLVHYRAGDRESAGREWRRGQEQDPDNPQVRAYLRLLESQAEHAGDSS